MNQISINAIIIKKSIGQMICCQVGAHVCWNEVTNGRGLAMDHQSNSIISIENSIIRNWAMQKQTGHFTTR